MNRIKLLILIVVTSFSLFTTCSTVPLTGRSQLNMIPNSEMLAMSFQQYDQFLGESHVSKKSDQTKMVKKVGFHTEISFKSIFDNRNNKDTY